MTILPSNSSTNSSAETDNGSQTSLTSTRSYPHSRTSILTETTNASSRSTPMSTSSCSSSSSETVKSGRCPNCHKQRRLKLGVPAAGPSSSHKSRARERYNRRKARGSREMVGSKTKCPTSYHFEDGEGCNSEDEYRLRDPDISDAEWHRKDAMFEDIMKRKGFIIKTVREDGACLFRAIAHQLYGTEDMHSVVRRDCMDYINEHSDFFSAFISEDIDHYVSRKRNNYVHGNQLEIEAISEKYNRTIEVYSYEEKPICVFTGSGKDGSPIRLAYQRNCHYNSIARPCQPPSSLSSSDTAHCSRLNDSTPAELSMLEQTMIEDKIAATDWEATYESMFEQATRESLASYVNDRRRRDPLAGCSSSATTSSACHRNNNELRLVSYAPSPPTSPRSSHHVLVTSPANIRLNIPQQPTHVQNMNTSQDPTGVYDGPYINRSFSSPSLTTFSNPPLSTQTDIMNNLYNFRFSESEGIETENVNHLAPEYIGGWDDDVLLARALAESQEEYLESLRRTTQGNQPDEQ